jgi:hypothetical protein
LAFDCRREGLQTIAEPAQTLQALVNIKKSRLAAHRLVSDCFAAMESETP